MILAGREARADPGGTPARARLARRGLGEAVLTRGPPLPQLSPVRTPQQHALARGRSGPGRPRAVRAPVGDAAAPSRCGTRSTGGGRPASRSSSPASSRLRAMGGAAARGTRAAWAARARPWRGASAARDDPAPQLCTAPPRPADAGPKPLHPAPTRTLAEVLRALREPAMPSPRRRRRRRQKHALVAFAENGGGALRERPHALGRRVVAWDRSTRPCPFCPACALPGPGGGARAPPAPKTQN